MAKTAKRQLKKNNTKKMKGGFLGRLAGWFSGNKEESSKPISSGVTAAVTTEQAPAQAQTPVIPTLNGGRRRNTKKATLKAKKAGRKAKKGARKANKSRRTRK